MKEIVQRIKESVQVILNQKYRYKTEVSDILVNETKPEFSGNYTVVLFSIVKKLKSDPDTLGRALGESLLETQPDLFSGFNVIKGFLNLEIRDGILFERPRHSHLQKHACLETPCPWRHSGKHRNKGGPFCGRLLCAVRHRTEEGG